MRTATGSSSSTHVRRHSSEMSRSSRCSGSQQFSVLVGRIADCAAAGRSGSIEPFEDATALWVALHGYATLQVTVPAFPWPSRHEFIGRLFRIAGIQR